MSLSKFDDEVRSRGYNAVAGVDEAGRGPLAGPVVAAACFIPEGMRIDAINDSKQLTRDQREDLFYLLTSQKEIQYGIGARDAAFIDERNILQATFDAMCSAVDALPMKPDLLLVDGKFLPQTALPARAVVKGDALSQCIAAASILAKTTRDRQMEEMDKLWPKYGFASHKGYGTGEHISAIKKYGAIPGVHRMTFAPIRSLLLPDLFQVPLTVRSLS